MRIMLTNDDGFFAPGIKALYKKLASDQKHQIFIVAPERQRSATGRSITLHKPLFTTRHALENEDIGFSLNGTPTDCVKLALQGDILPFKPDLLISGINDGPNLGTDVFYSGTVSAAMEGALLGVPSLAVSLASNDYDDFIPTANYIKHLIDSENEIIHYKDGLTNINIPGTPEKDWKGVRITKLGQSTYDNSFEYRKAPLGKEYYWITGKLIFEDEEDTDLKVVHEGYISLTPLHGDLTDYKRIEALKKLQSDGEI